MTPGFEDVIPTPPGVISTSPVISTPYLVISRSEATRNLVFLCHFDRREKSCFPLSFRTPPLSFRTYVRNLVFKGSRFLTRLRRFGMTMRMSFRSFCHFNRPLCHFDRREKSCFALSFRPSLMSFRTYVRNLVFKGSGFLTHLRRFGMTMGMSLRPFCHFNRPYVISTEGRNLVFKGSRFLTRLRRF